ncbi:MAG: crossover junction endodeoxyribonuclease RuvC [Elusimicrobia bacterium]|nr:crossover junction endodeoxyribonuclease RuvC [Elusimicrobiota bacterium]
MEVHGRGNLPCVGYGAIETPRARPLAERVLFWPGPCKQISSSGNSPLWPRSKTCLSPKTAVTAASVGHGRGAILLTLAELGLPIHEYNPRQVKVALTGYGAADKSQMQTMVQRLLRLKEIPKPDDAADAWGSLCATSIRPPTPGVRG